jgi:predicted phage terminase large subunit-like protein
MNDHPWPQNVPEPEELAAWLDGGSGRLSWEQVLGILGPLHRHLAEARRRQARSAQDGGAGLLDWGRTYLPAYFTRPASRLHHWLADALEEMQHQRGLKLNVLGPRGAAKSTLGTLSFVLRMALERHEPYIWILSDTRQQAHAHLENLKAELIDNPRLAADYPGATGRGPVWRAGSIVLRNGVAIQAFGTGQRIRGRRHREVRPSLIVCDDLQNDSHIHSALQRERSRGWLFGTLLKAGTAETNVLNLATALHHDALAMLLCRTPGWTWRIFRAIERWPDQMLLWQQWESLYADVENPAARQAAREFYGQHHEAMHAGAVLLWPEVEDLYTLMCLRAENGHVAFEREKQNSPVNPELCEWPESYFDGLVWFDQWPCNLRLRVLTLDPSKGRDARHGDYSAFIRLGLDGLGIFYVEADLARRPTPQIVADGVEHYRQFHPDAFGVESNQFQEILGELFLAEFQRQGLLGVQPWLIGNQLNKQVRIRRLGPYLATHRLRLKADSPATRLLLDQLQQFPLADHDDGPDALEMALRLAEELLGHPDDGLGNRLAVEQ